MQGYHRSRVPNRISWANCGATLSNRGLPAASLFHIGKIEHGHGVLVRSVSRVSAFSQPAIELELLTTISHPLGRRVAPVFASRAQLVATLEAQESRGELPLFPKRDAQVAVTLGMIGFQRDGLAVGSHCVAGSTRASKEIAEGVVGVGMIGLQLDGTSASGGRLVKLALVAEDLAKL
jgi:hypothetical protein